MTRNKNAGFTLVELLIAMLISMIVIAGVAQFIVVGTKQYETIGNQSEMQQEAVFALNMFTDMVLESDNVKTITKGSETYICLYYNSGQAKQAEKVLWNDTSSNKLYLFDCDENSLKLEDVINGAHSEKKLFAEYVKRIHLSCGGTAFGSNTSYSELKQGGIRNPVINVEMDFEIKKDRNDTDTYTFKAENAVAPRNEIVVVK